MLSFLYKNLWFTTFFLYKQNLLQSENYSYNPILLFNYHTFVKKQWYIYMITDWFIVDHIHTYA